MTKVKQKKNQELEEITNQLKRALADYQNLEKRTLEEKKEWIMSGNKSLVASLLPVLDNLFLAQKHIQDEGLDLSINKFLEVLEGEGVTKIVTDNQEFDPNTMECVTVQEGEKNKIIEEIRPGYVMNDNILRAAQVVVGGKE